MQHTLVGGCGGHGANNFLVCSHDCPTIAICRHEVDRARHIAIKVGNAVVVQIDLEGRDGAAKSNCLTVAGVDVDRFKAGAG